MNGVALAARLVLVGVFALAGAAKLRDRPGTRSTLEDFGLPATLAGPGALALPIAELVVATLLLFDATAVAGAVGALILLGAFTGGITASLARGERPDCNCFGQLHSEPVGPRTLARNATLAALAAVVLALGPTDAGAAALHGVGRWDTATALAAGALALSALTLGLVVWMGLHLLRQQGRALLRLDALDGGDERAPAPAAAGLPVGAPAPDFEMESAGGERVRLDDLLVGGGRAALTFVDPDCGPCRSLLPDLARAGDGVAVVISRAGGETARALAGEHGLSRALVDPDGDLAAAYEAPMTPSAVAIGSDGLIVSELAAGEGAVRDLLRRLGEPAADSFALPLVSVGEEAGPGGPVPGERVPDVELADLDGARVSLRAAVGGAPYLLLFWSPTCGFCDSMLEDVRALEQREGLPPMLLVATGDAEANRAQALRSPILLDPGFAATGAALGVLGTPSALRLDADGRVVSNRAVGPEQVLTLAGDRDAVNARGGGAGPAG